MNVIRLKRRPWYGRLFYIYRGMREWHGPVRSAYLAVAFTWPGVFYR